MLFTPPLKISDQPSLSKSPAPTMISFVFPADSPPPAILATVPTLVNPKGDVVIAPIFLFIKLNFLLEYNTYPFVTTEIKSLVLPFGTITDNDVVVAALTFA